MGIEIWQPPPVLPLSKHVIENDYVIVAGYSATVVRYLEIAAGVTLEIGTDSDLEIT